METNYWSEESVTYKAIRTSALLLFTLTQQYENVSRALDQVHAAYVAGELISLFKLCTPDYMFAIVS